MTEPKVLVHQLVGRHRNRRVSVPLSVAQNLEMTGQGYIVEQAVQPLVETRVEPEPMDLAGLSKPELVALAEERGIVVTRADGGDGVPLKSDYLRVLS